MITKYPQTNNAAAKNSVRPSEGAAEGGSRGEFRRARAEVPHQVRDKLRSRRPAR